MSKKLFLFAILIGFLALGFVFLNNRPDPEPKLSPDQRFAALVEEYETQYTELMADYEQAGSKGDRQRMKEIETSFRNLKAKQTETATEIAGETTEPELAAKALTWIVKHNSRNQRAHKAFGRIKEEHLDSPVIGDAIASVITDVKTMEYLATRSPHEDIRAIASYFLARREQDDAEKERLLTAIERDSSDVEYRGRRLGELVEVPLKVIRHLTVGKVALDIEAEDIDGKKFKLSDYRGKVVMLDFWGDW